MKLLASCSLGGAGHWLPLAEFLRASMRPTDTVVVVAPPALREMVERDGFTFVEGGEPPAAVIGPIRERLPTAPPDEAAVLGNRVLFAELAATAMLPHVDGVCERWRPDLLVRDPCEYAGAIVAGARSIPSAHVGISQAEVEWGSLSIASPALEQHRTGLTAEIASSPYISRFPDLIDPSPFATTLRYRTRPVAAPEPLPDWWTPRTSRSGRGAPRVGEIRPLVYVTFGTVLPYMSFATDAYRFALDALAPMNARVLLTVGRTFSTSGLGEIPANAHVEAWIGQDRVLREAAVVVCHGGSGTLLGAIEAEVPLVVMPFFSDQRTNGQLVDRHRLGQVVVPTVSPYDRRPAFGREDAEALAAAVSAVLADRSSFDGFTDITADWDDTPPAADVLAQLVS